MARKNSSAWEKMRGSSGVKKVKQWRKKGDGRKVLVGVTLEEGATRNQPRVAVVDHQRLVHVVAHLLLNLKVGQVKNILTLKQNTFLVHTFAYLLLRPQDKSTTVFL